MLSKPARPIVHTLAAQGILGGVSLGRLFPDAPELEHGLVIAVTETVTEDDIEALAATLQEALA